MKGGADWSDDFLGLSQVSSPSAVQNGISNGDVFDGDSAAAWDRSNARTCTFTGGHAISAACEGECSCR